MGRIWVFMSWLRARYPRTATAVSFMAQECSGMAFCLVSSRPRRITVLVPLERRQYFTTALSNLIATNGSREEISKASLSPTRVPPRSSQAPRKEVKPSKRQAGTSTPRVETGRYLYGH
ncbi:hypothetical protein QBC36DRAFT_129751 [Triangularia setosa]|uniref:Uncharacterized protein n=1 Tax=Triangularia setosa TaxID=2587417 RepID=A0AAN7AAA5_9PEZI|nr:hypothetical protein QBC36DRAFT_129751 [Podospora setosa]